MRQRGEDLPTIERALLVAHRLDAALPRCQPRRQFIAPRLCGYPPHQITLLHNAAATRSALLAALDSLAATTGPDSTVVIYYAGHGDYGADSKYYLTTHDSRREGDRIAQASGLCDDELLTKVRTIPAKRLLLLFNACHAGALSPNRSVAPPIALGSDPLPEETLDALLATGEGRIIITACRPQQRSWVGNGQLTLFTQALVEGLRGQGYVANCNGYISAFGLYEHLYASVKERAADLGYQQDPELTVLRGVGPFPVALYRGATALGPFDPQEELPIAAVRTVTPERSQRMLKRYLAQISNTTITTTTTTTTTATVGERGVNIGGNADGNTIITGDGNRVRRVNTGGGTYIKGNVNTGGGDFVGRDKKSTSYTAFDQSGQTVFGPQTNIDGGVNTAGGIFNSGIMTTGAAPTQPTLAAHLRALQHAIVQAGQAARIDEETAIDVDAALQKAIRQADKATPDPQAILAHLATARDKLAPIPAAGGLVEAIDAVSRW